jgi:hypothetical protein
MAWLSENNPDYLVLPLALLTGVVVAVGNGADLLLDPGISATLPLLLLLLIWGLVQGLGQIYILGPILRRVAGKRGGIATTAEVRAALAWGSLPSLWSLPVLLLASVFLTSVQVNNPSLAAFDTVSAVSLLGCFTTPLSLWSFFLTLILLSETLDCSTGSAFWYHLLASLVWLVPYLGIELLFSGLLTLLGVPIW